MTNNLFVLLFHNFRAENVCYQRLTVQVDVEIVVLVLYLYCDGKAFGTDDDVRWNSKNSLPPTHRALGISLKHNVSPVDSPLHPAMETSLSTARLARESYQRLPASAVRL